MVKVPKQKLPLYVKMDVLAIRLSLVIVCLVSCNGFLFDVKTDCLVSTWSSWVELPGLDMHIRERGILRHDRFGGIPCPPDDELRDVRAGIC